ncbi:MAG: glycosyltransferase family 2 protein [Acidobacteria bacterium]|nr:glycosyltransferase family 2 protein [Acidobacteriota bacterium]
MEEKRRVSVVIPAYNEEGIIGEVISEVKKLSFVSEILVVDDGSNDKTAEIAERKGARVIRHPYNKGNGAAVKTGIRNATGEIVVLMDGDGQHNPRDIEKLVSELADYDLVVGTRGKDYASPLSRKWGNRILARLASMLTGVRIPDLTSGFRAAERKHLLEFVHLFPNGFSYPTTCTLAFLKAGYSVKFEPVNQFKRKGGRSKINLISDGIRFFLLILKTITLFHPLKIFIPFALFFLLLGGGYGIYTIITERHVTNSSVLLISMAVIIFLVGLVSEQIALFRFERRE